MKKVFSLLLVAVLLVTCMATVAFADENYAFSASYESNIPGGTVNVTVSTGEITYQDYGMYVSYDPEMLTLQSVVAGAASNGTFGYNDNNGKIKVAVYGGDEATKSGTLFTLTFKISESAKPGDFSNIGVEIISVRNEAQDFLSVSGKNGKVTVICDHSGETETKIENEVPGNCGVAGSYDKVVYCKACGAELSRETITVPATGNHTAGNPVRENEKPATCGAAGSYESVVYCSVCGEELSRETIAVPATGNHTAGNPVRENEVPATCKDAGSYDEVVYCSICGEEISREKKTIDKLTTHTPGEPVRENEVPATCKETGSYDEVIYCSVCGEELSRETKTIGLADHTPGKPVIENKVDATCSKAGSYEEVVYCSVCGEEISRVKQTIEKLPHVDKDDDGKCDNCGEDMDDDEPKNGDITPYPVFFLAAVMAVMAVAYGLKRKFSV